MLSPIIQYALLRSPDDTTQAVAAGKHQDLKRAFVQHDWEVRLQELEMNFIRCGNLYIQLLSIHRAEKGFKFHTHTHHMPPKKPVYLTLQIEKAEVEGILDSIYYVFNMYPCKHFDVD